MGGRSTYLQLQNSESLSALKWGKVYLSPATEQWELISPEMGGRSTYLQLQNSESLSALKWGEGLPISSYRTVWAYLPWNGGGRSTYLQLQNSESLSALKWGKVYLSPATEQWELISPEIETAQEWGRSASIYKKPVRARVYYCCYELTYLLVTYWPSSDLPSLMHFAWDSRIFNSSHACRPLKENLKHSLDLMLYKNL